MNIIKRNGAEAKYNKEKIINAISKAMAEVGNLNTNAAKVIADNIEIELSKLNSASVEEIQDMVEVELMQFDPIAAKAFIIYRNERKRIREMGWNLDELQTDIYNKKYRYKAESFDEFLDRISNNNSEVKKAIRDKKFLPGGRILAGRGLAKDGKKITMSNCFVVPPVEDNIEGIYKTAAELARVFSYGGGCGVDISKLRPKNSRVNNAAKTTSGAVSFMDLFSLTGELVGQAGRRAALMISMDINHPDIEEFIDVKKDLTKVTKANISIKITDAFMNAAIENKDFNLEFTIEPTGEKIVKKIKARKILNKLAQSNWEMAEPGVLFWDRIKSYNLMSEVDWFEYASCNPCGEQPLPSYGSCNLSSINLSTFVKKPFTKQAFFDFNEFERIVKLGVRFLNEILDENIPQQPLAAQQEVGDLLRQIGLGVMGIADMFIKMGIKYGSQESLNLSHKIGFVLANTAMQESAKLNPTKNEPLTELQLQSDYFKHVATPETKAIVQEKGLYNTQLLTIAPTGTISLLMGCSNGIEPLFQISYTRKSESLHDEDTYYKIYSPVVKELMEAQNIINEVDLPDYVVTSSQIDYKSRIALQAVWQTYIDAAISSTVNVPEGFTVAETVDLYVTAWEKGLKGITMYRDNCFRTGILTTNTEDKEESNESREEREGEWVCTTCD